MRLGLWCCVLVCLLGHLEAGGAEEGFEPIFDGASLAGWAGQDMSFWTVEAGAITGTITPEHRPGMNQYLVWQGGLVEDFELKLEFRLTGSQTPDTNGGFQFRSRRLPDGDVAGYQVDNNFGQPWKVRLYDEFGRHDLAREGERAVFGPDGSRTVEPLPLERGATDFRLDEWHEYHLVADGPRLELRINSQRVAATTDGDADSFEPRGVLAMQLHTGPPMKAQFRNLRLKRLREPAVAGSREALIAEAALHWDLGERADAHQPPLKAVGNVSVMSGDGSERFARIDAGGFDPRVDLNRPAAWNVAGEALTVHARVRLSPGGGAKTVASKGSGETAHFRLSVGDLAETPGEDVAFEVTTEEGHFRASFPVSRIEAGAWHDLVGRYDGQRLQLLCDGEVMAEREARGRLVPNEEPVLIGTEAVGGQVGQVFSGDFARLSLWTRALSDEELAVVSGRQ